MKTKLLFSILCFCFLNNYAGGISTISPQNDQVSPIFNVTFSWNKVLNVTTYKLKIASDAGFTSIIKDTLITGTTALVKLSPTTQAIYWKVSSYNYPAYVESPAKRVTFLNPTQDPNLLMWFAADSNVVMNPDSTISSWNNIIPNGLDAVQANSLMQPKLASNIFQLANNKAVRFDGNDLFRINSGGVVGSVYVLCNFTGSAGNNFPDYNAILTRQGIANFDDYFITFVANSPNFENSGYFKNNTFVNNILSNNFSPLVKYKVMSGRRTLSLNSPANFMFGAENPGTRFWVGDISEMIVSKNTASSESDSIHSYLFSKYSPPVNLGPDTIVGTSFSDPVILSVPNRFSTYLWSSGSTTSTASVLSGGRYTLKTRDIFGIDTEDDIEVYPYRRLNNLNIYLCAGDSITVNLGITAPFTFLWSTGAVTNSIKIKTAGTYTVKVTDFKGQFLFDTINVFIDNPVLSPNPSGGSLSLCQGQKLFAVTQTAYDSIRWSTGSTANFITVNTAGPYSVFGRTTAGCILNKSFNVTIAGQAPAADFVTNIICQNTPAAFTDISTYPVGNSIVAWQWTFGDGNTSNSPVPTNAYSGLGTYSASLKVTTNLGCSDSIVKTVTVRKRPTADFYNLLSCSGISTTFVDNSIANSDSIQSWFWNFAGLGNSTEKNPKFNFPSANSYNTFLQVTNSFGCKDSITKPTIVNPSPVADFKADSACSGSNTTFINMSTVGSPFVITNYLWEYGDEAQSIQVSQPHLYSTYGTYSVRLSIRASNQCVDTVVKTVRVFATPTVDFTISNTQCTGKSIQFTDISSTPDGSLLNDWKWFFSGQGTSTQQNPAFAFNTQGNYTVQLTAKTTAGCSASKFRSIAVTSPPVVNFSFSPNYGPPPLNVTYTNLSPNNSNYIWDYGDGSSTVNGYTPPPHTYTVGGTFPIKLIATDFKGCSDSLVKDILVGVPVIDGVMVSVSILPNGDYYKVVATVLNNSNIEITSLGLTMHLQNGSEVREIWTGSLKPGNSVIYPFIGQLHYSSGDIPVICATIESINVNAQESDLSNNSSCEEITVGPFEVLTVYPNPSTDNVNFGVMLPANGDVEITLYDLMGKLLYGVQFAGVTGYNNLRMPVSVLNASVYIAEIKYDGALIRKKIMRTDK